MVWATFWANFSQAHLVALLSRLSASNSFHVLPSNDIFPCVAFIHSATNLWLIRVTRLGEISHIGRLFTQGSFLKNKQVPQSFVLLYCKIQAICNF
jgi:hypothetical protein